MRENLREAAALLCHCICTVLAHADIVTEAMRRKQKLRPVILHGEARRPQSENCAEKLAAPCDTAAADLQHGSGRRAFRRCEPLCRIRRKAACRLLCAECLLQGIRRNADGLLIVRRTAVCIRFDRNQIGKRIAPDGLGRLCFTG